MVTGYELESMVTAFQAGVHGLQHRREYCPIPLEGERMDPKASMGFFDDTKRE